MASANEPLEPEDLARVFAAAEVSTVEGADEEGWATATVRGLDRVVASVKLKDGAYKHFEQVGLSANQRIGAQVLALAVKQAIQQAQRAALVRLHSQVVRQAPRPDPWDEYWALPEHERPESYEEFLSQRPSSRGPELGPEERIAADDRAGLYKDRVMRVDLDPVRIRATPPGERHGEATAAGYDRLADELARVAAIPPTAVFTEADDKSDPTAAVTVDQGGNVVEVWLHQDVFRRVGSHQLGPLVAKAAVKASEGMLAMLTVALGDQG